MNFNCVFSRKWLFVLFSVALSVLMLEFSLGTFDPWGMCYYDDLYAVLENFVPHPSRGYAMTPGFYRYRGWSARIGTDYTRYVPASDRHGDLTIVFLGDSMTFGYGVDDSETFANLVARELGGTRVINAGVTGYNSTNVRDTLAALDADLYVYLVYSNDDDPELDYASAHDDGRLWLWRYTEHLFNRLFNKQEQTGASNRDALIDDLRAMIRNERVTLVAFDNVFGREIAGEIDGVELIPMYHHKVSVIDAHPNAEGHREIAAALLPLVEGRLGDE